MEAITSFQVCKSSSYSEGLVLSKISAELGLPSRQKTAAMVRAKNPQASRRCKRATLRLSLHRAPLLIALQYPKPLAHQKKLSQAGKIPAVMFSSSRVRLRQQHSLLKPKTPGRRICSGRFRSRGRIFGAESSAQRAPWSCPSSSLSRLRAAQSISALCTYPRTPL